MFKQSQKHPTYFLKKALKPIINPKSTEDDRLFHEFMGFFAQLTPSRIASNIRLLSSYRIPDNIYPFLVIGTILGYSLGEIYRNYVTPNTRVMMWKLFANVWNQKVKDKYTPFFIKLKNRIYRMFGGETYQNYQEYITNLNEAFNKTVNFYECLLNLSIITSSSIKIDTTLDVLSDHEEQQKSKKIANMAPNLIINNNYIKFFGNNFNRDNISSLGILINVIRLDYAKSKIMDKKKSPPVEQSDDDKKSTEKSANNEKFNSQEYQYGPLRCQLQITNIGGIFVNIHDALTKLGDQYGVAQIKAVKNVFKKCFQEMDINPEFL